VTIFALKISSSLFASVDRARQLMNGVLISATGTQSILPHSLIDFTLRSKPLYTLNESIQPMAGQK
jgi:hypothetical protein